VSGSSERRISSATAETDPRFAATRLIDRLLRSGYSAAALLEAARAAVPPKDRALLNELVLGTLRWLRRIDHVAEAASGRRMARIDRRIRSPLRVGIHQLLFLDRVPEYAAVDRAVEDARCRRGSRAAGFVNAVLRRVAGSSLADWPVVEATSARRLAIEHSHPDLLVEAWLERFGEATTVELMETNNRPRGAHLLAFRDRGGRRRLARELAGEGVACEPSSLSPLGLEVTAGDVLATESFRRGLTYVQDSASQAAPLVVPPEPGERILDAAAAPGGKSLALSAWEPAARLTAMDLRPERAARMRSNFGRLGRPIPVVVGDALGAPFEGSFDRVVLDLPCTGSGILRKHPELKWRIERREIERLARNGLAMLGAVAGQVAVGGRLIVITCSIEPQENERVVERFLRRRPDFAPVALEDRIPAKMRRGIEVEGRWRVLPSATNDGFTVHALARG
jgi:16S rRNA (cytosine967-C5)-methyltransferase